MARSPTAIVKDVYAAGVAVVSWKRETKRIIYSFQMYLTTGRERLYSACLSRCSRGVSRFKRLEICTSRGNISSLLEYDGFRIQKCQKGNFSRDRESPGRISRDTQPGRGGGCTRVDDPTKIQRATEIRESDNWTDFPASLSHLLSFRLSLFLFFYRSLIPTFARHLPISLVRFST